MNTSSKPRLVWIDTAKGICILLVILSHTTTNIFSLSHSLCYMMEAVRMPLYYTIAGFFVFVSSKMEFLTKKINRLIVPYVFFLILGNLMGYYDSYINNTDYFYFSSLYFAFTEGKDFQFHNIPIWFLISLFDTYIYYMIIDSIAKRINKYYFLTKLLLSLFLGLCGFICHRLGIDLPFFLDSSMTAFPFFMWGHLLMRKTTFLSNKRNRWHDFILASILLFLAFIWRTRQTLWREYAATNPKNCC